MTWKPFREPSVETDSTPVKRSLAQLAKKLGAGAPDAMAVIFEDWEAVVGKDLASHAKPESLADGLLIVSVPDAMWLSQMKWMTSGIADSINKRVGNTAVERVEVRLRRLNAPK